VNDAAERLLTTSHLEEQMANGPEHHSLTNPPKLNLKDYYLDVYRWLISYGNNDFKRGATMEVRDERRGVTHPREAFVEGIARAWCAGRGKSWNDASARKEGVALANQILDEMEFGSN
jgi:hypothetical protein